MLAITLTTAQKFQVAFILAILSVAGYFVFQATRPEYDRAVDCQVFPRRFGVNRNAPISARNPVDPKLEERVTQFECSDGRISIIEYVNDASKAPAIVFAPDRRSTGTAFQYYYDPMTIVDQIKDPTRHALAYAVYNMIYGKKLGLMDMLGLSTEQIAQAKDAQGKMEAANADTNKDIAGGAFRRDLLDKVMAALKTYNARSGDPKKDTAKADLARQVLTEAGNYLRQQYADKDQHIGVYMDSLAKVLTADQKQKLIDLVKQRTAPRTTGQTPVTRRGTTTMSSRAGGAGRVTTPVTPVTPTTMRGGTTTLRGGATTQRGGTTTGRGLQ